LGRIIQSLCSRRARAAQQIGVDLSAMVGDATYSAEFDRPWREFCKSLHPQSLPGRKGEWRATCFADLFFTDKALVDTPLRTEYFAHLPGILTGIGIIGTFRGLIEGLRNFLPSLNPNAMQEALNNLIGIVANAFLTSAAAIVLAILFTLIEKVLLNACYRKVEEIQQIVDRMFRSGAGEEYLELLAGASAAYATQAKELKNELVSDLRQVLNEVARTQVEAVVRSGKDTSNRVAEVIVQRLGGPIDNISEAVKYVGANQRDAMQAMLGDVFVTLMESVDKAFGSKMDGIATLLVQTMKEMEETASRLDELAASVASVAKDSVGSLAVQLNDALRQMAATQEATALQTSESLARIQEVISRLQEESAEKHLQALSRIGDQVAMVAATQNEQLTNLLEQQRRESARSLDNAVDLVRILAREVEKLVDSAGEATASLQGGLSSFVSSSHDEIGRMASGAELLYASSSELAKSAASATASIAKLCDAIDRFEGANCSLERSVTATARTVDNYEKDRNAFAETLSGLKLVLNNAKREASVTSEMLAGIQGAAAQLANAGLQSEAYLGKVNDVLAKAHMSFAENIDKTLNHGNSRFHVELAKAVDLLAGGIRDLEDVLSAVPARSQ